MDSQQPKALSRSKSLHRSKKPGTFRLESELGQLEFRPGEGGGGTPIWNRRGRSSEILNLTPKGDHLGVAQAFRDAKGDQSGRGLSKF